MKKENVVEILYTDECPFWKETLRLISEVIADLKTDVTIKKVKVKSEEDAKKLKFPGSPTVRVNGVDIDPAATETAGYIGCRIYRQQGKTYELPPKQMIKAGFERLLPK
jgi:glutaredoxin